MMKRKLKVGINGLGRIGRAIFRINQKQKIFDVPVINDINPDNHNIAYLLKYDTTYGKADFDVKDDNGSIYINNEKIDIHHKEGIADVPWENYEVDLVIDSSGVKQNLFDMQKCRSKVKNFIVTNSPDEVDQTIILGVNDHELNLKNFIISASICDAVALAPILKVVESLRKIEGGFLTTLHAWLSYQNLLDGPSASWSVPGDIHSHYALGRATPMNMIPKSTSAIIAVKKVMPWVKHINSHSFRIPTNIVSGADLMLQLDKEITAEELIQKFKEYEKNQKYKILKNSVEPLTSLDYKQEEFSAIIDHRWTTINNGRLVKLVYWYDNEWGYSSRVVDIIKEIAELKD